eukprot:TRINITY_DN20511_c0_g1_i1.p1 TRINITY_DN20511_c0_g1~~TRINITY_DN20511_c0_g1_i1.p1  ORF type:complete len:513 (+),score=77.36 TRINITY_DN20511_c0_g1_i1:29-1567(+)
MEAGSMSESGGEQAAESGQEELLLAVSPEASWALRPTRKAWLLGGLTIWLGAIEAAMEVPRRSGDIRLGQEKLWVKVAMLDVSGTSPVLPAWDWPSGQVGVSLASGDVNYDTVFNETLVDCVSKTLATNAQAFCFDSMYTRDPFCRKLYQDKQASCEAVKNCLLGHDHVAPTNPCEVACTGADQAETLSNCRIQFEAAQELSSVCVPRGEPHDQQVDWRVLQTMKYVKKMAGQCGWVEQPLVYPPPTPPQPGMWNSTEFPNGSMYCFTMMMPNTNDTKLVELMEYLQGGIFGCDEATVYSSYVMQLGNIWTRELERTDLVAPRNPTDNLMMTTMIYRNLWRQMMDEGRWRYHDWAIKVDCDAVFFPFRLKYILTDPYVAKTAKNGTGLMLNNCNSGFQGSIEVLSQTAVRTFHESWLLCGAHPAQEAAYFDACIKFLNVQSLDTNTLLATPYCSNPVTDSNNCSAGNFVAFAPKTAPDAWQACWRQVVPAPTTTIATTTFPSSAVALSDFES